MKLRSVYFSEPMKVFGHMRSNPQDFETCIAHVLKFSQDLISSEMLFPQLRTKFLLKRHPKPQWYKLYPKSSRRWALTDLRFHLMLSLYTSWEKYYGAESASFPVVHGDFGCNVTCQACRENSPRMTIGTPRLARTAQTCLGRRLGSQNLTRESEWEGPLVGCWLKFSNFVVSRLKFSIFVGSRLNVSILADRRKISVNK